MLLTSYDGKSITYDAIGNPLHYYNGTDFTWGDGRKLTHAQLDSKRALDIQYDASGLMYKKTMTETGEASVYKEVTEYYYSGGALISFQVSKYLDTSMYESTRAWLLYDESGDLIGIRYGGVNYNYLRMEKRVVSRSEMETNAIWATNRFSAAYVASRWIGRYTCVSKAGRNGCGKIYL